MSNSSHTILETDQVPQPIGPYSIGTRAGSLIFLSGNLGLDPASGGLSPGGIESETRQALENIRAALRAGGASLEDVLKVTVFLRNLDDYGAMNAVYGEFFPADPPARSAVQVARLPLDASVEIEVIAESTG